MIWTHSMRRCARCPMASARSASPAAGRGAPIPDVAKPEHRRRRGAGSRFAFILALRMLGALGLGLAAVLLLRLMWNADAIATWLTDVWYVDWENKTVNAYAVML